ncbi:hypothetical protein [Paraliobacillus sediminis]|uniref:hypothetical protein n=1 Tax=Paraliobacillus sediminis TaxID=1885916 RepID=UPI0013C2CC35|nr:hypothetical protein [Paraliobacillus sediminis]
MQIQRLIQNIGIIGKHIEKNEKYFRYPEKKVQPTIKDIENQMNQFENEMLKWEKLLE